VCGGGLRIPQQVQFACPQVKYGQVEVLKKGMGELNLHQWCFYNRRQSPLLSNLLPEAHVCNPSYSGGRDQEDLGSNPAQGK
jgi:hypothetical protein